jgi:hypothetical protein
MLKTTLEVLSNEKTPRIQQHWPPTYIINQHWSKSMLAGSTIFLKRTFGPNLDHSICFGGFLKCGFVFKFLNV